ncbi:helix-turn-helix domain-containing protein [Kitasatospora sp. SUK 42]|uniref:winged helix-turn-helix transcriptional regulator n=1 Tax=Kitasatospora sp. SUK 42 TaxID=1588882 RepID=UPI0018CA9131|nr:helix-turn-helix domain-containing protein [Kitasatospora sp. SUK 42]MBV2152316.1 helix-turn-helix transcriptional regulator [Kitasatospora sp. SUK 42]
MTTDEAVAPREERDRDQDRGREQVREEEFDVFAQLCPSREMFADLADKWSMLILMSLAACGPQRFSELQRGVGGVSRKMLTQSLRNLERSGLVLRTVFPETPPRVVYDLLPLGRELAELLSPLGRWTEGHALQMLAAREEFDAAHARD